MNILFMVLLLFWIDPGSGTTDEFVLVRLWLDHGKPCEAVTDDLWSIQDQIIQNALRNDIKFTTFNKDYTTCGCSETHSTCYPNHTNKHTELTFRYNLTHPSDHLNLLRPNITINSTKVSAGHDKRTYFLCAVVTPSSTADQRCNPTTEKQSSDVNQPTSSKPNIGVIAGASLAALAALAGVALAYPLYRHLKKNRNQVDPDKDITPIIPGDFGITDAPNSVAPAGI